MPTKKELLQQLEELKIKEESDKNENIQKEFTKQKTYLMNKLRDFVEIEISDKEIGAIFSNNNCYFGNEKNLLLQRKFYNKYARHHEIRYEDSEDIIKDFLNKIKPIDNINEAKNIYRKQGGIILKINNTSSDDFIWKPLYTN